MSELASLLAVRLSERFDGDVEITDLRRLTGGASRETWAFTAVPRRASSAQDTGSAGTDDPGRATRPDVPGEAGGSGAAGGSVEAGGAAGAGSDVGHGVGESGAVAAAAETAVRRRRLVLRRDPPGAGRPDRMARESAAIAAAERAGLPVPHLVDHGGDPSVLGAPYLITDHVDGETIVRRLQRDDRYADARTSLAAELGRAVAGIHSIPVDAVPGLEHTDPLDRIREPYDALAEPSPAVEIALKWLDAHRPPSVPEAVVHGDFRAGNVIVDETGLRAVIDWEGVHRGDPREDLGWVCVKAWRFGSPLAAGGFGTLESLLDGYESVAGHRPDPDAVRWWQIWGSAWWAVGCRIMAERHLSGETRSVELAAIGRRVCEQEHDVLLELGLPATPVPESAASAEPGPPDPATDGVGRVAPRRPAWHPTHGAPRDVSGRRSGSPPIDGTGRPPQGGAGPGTPDLHGRLSGAEPVVSAGADLHGRPTASELVAVVAAFLRDDVMPATEGRLSFLARVAANALDGVERELALGPEQEERHRARLAVLGRSDRADLAAAIRSGEVDADDPALLAAVRAEVTDRLAVANPRYLEQP